MAGKTQKLIQELQQVRQALRAVGIEAEEVDKKIRMLTSQTVKVSAFGTGKRTGENDPVLNPKSVSRIESRVVSASQGTEELKRIETLGKEFRVTMNRVIASVVKGLQSDLDMIKGGDWTTIPGNQGNRNLFRPAGRGQPRGQNRAFDIGESEFAGEQTARTQIPREQSVKLREMRRYIELLKQDWVALGRAPQDFDKIIDKVVGKSVNNLKKLEEGAAKAAQKIAELSPRNVGGTPAVPTPATDVRTVLPRLDPVSGPLTPNQLGKEIVDLKDKYKRAKLDVTEFNQAIKNAAQQSDKYKALRESLDSLINKYNQLTSAANKAAGFGTPATPTRVAPPTSPTGGTASRPQTFDELSKEIPKVREALEKAGKPLDDFDARIKRAMDTGDVKILEVELRDLISTLNAVGSAAQQAATKTDISGTSGLKGKQPQHVNTDEDYRLAQAKASMQADESIRKQGAMLPFELQGGAQQLGKEYITGLNARITAVAKLDQEQAALNNTQAKEVQYVDNATLKTKRLQGGVVELTASFRAQNQEIQKGSKYYKEVGGVWEELEKAGDKLSIAQKQRVAESAGRGDFDTAALKKQADRYKFDIQRDLKCVETEATTGITRYRLEKPITKPTLDPKTGEMVDKATGAFSKLNVTLDKNGVLLNDTQKRFRSFGDAIVRDVGEVLKWSIAVGLVYGGMQKLSEMVQIAIENQTKLVDITIALGNAQRTTSDIFKDAATIAQASGESISGVLESYTLAYRAAGDIADPIARTSAANKFLSDSLVLSKLSALDQAAALDTLSGALKQTADLGETTEDMFARSTFLLDSWVATTKAANVDMATLATAFSITSESAENAGLTLRELNAVIAVMSEKIGALGPKETGNTVRALIGGIYSQNAAQELAKFGITVQDATGKSRGFLDIMTQIYQLNQKGLINDDQLNKLALALGGGVRRGQQYLAFITGLGRVNEVVAAQTDVNGQAQAALSMQLETVQTAITRLGNSFQGLSQALGTEGGFLTGAKLTLDILTKLVDIITQLTSVAGKAGPVLLATMAAASYLGKGSRGTNLSTEFAGGMGGLFGQSSLLSGQGFFGKPNKQIGFDKGYGFGAALTKGAGFIAPAISAGMNLSQGDTKGAGANMAGALLAGLSTGFNPIAMAVGSLIGESFVNVVGAWLDTKARDTSAVLAEAGGTETGKPPKTELELYQEKRAKQEEEIWSQIYEIAGKRAMPALSSLVGENKAGKLASGFFQQFTGQGQQETALGIAGFTPTQGGEGLAGKYKDLVTNRIFADLSEEDKALLDELIKQLDQSGKEFVRTAENITERGSTNIQDQVENALRGRKEGDLFTSYAQEQSTKALQGLTKGEISAKEQRNVISSLPGLPAASLQLYTALGGTADDIGRLSQEITGMTSQEDVLKRLMDLLITAPEEATLYIKTLAGDINDLTDIIAEAQKTGAPIKFGDQEFTSAAEAMTLLTEKTDEYKSALKGMYIEMARTTIKVPDVQSFEDATSKQMEEIIKNARANQEEEYKAILPELTDQQLREYFEGFEPYFAKTKEDYQEIFALDPKFLQEEYQKAAQAGKIASQNIDFGFFEADKYQLAEQYYSQTAANLTKLGYKEDNTPSIVALDNGTIQKTTKDSKIMSLLMSQLVDLSEKQLDGIYNLPTSASFYVPSQAAGMAGGGGGGGYDISGLERLANADVIGEEIPTPTTTNADYYYGTSYYSKFLEEENKRVEANLLQQETALNKEKAKEQPSPWAGLAGPSSQVPLATQDITGAFTDAMKETSPWANQTGPSTNLDDTVVKTLDNAFQQLLQQQGGGTGGGDFKGLMDSLNNIKVNSQLELKQNITANVSIMLNQALVGRAVAKYLEEQQLIFSQNSITKNTVI